MVRVQGIHNAGRTATVLLRGSNKLVLEEADRSLHDALCVVRCLVQKQYLVPGGGAPEMEVGAQLTKWAQTLQVCVWQSSVACMSLCAVHVSVCAAASPVLVAVS